MNAQLFRLGSIVATPGAIQALSDANIQPMDLLKRHSHGDWGDVDKEDARENDLSVSKGFRILSVYQLPTGVKVWLITEADRSSTCFLLPDEY